MRFLREIWTWRWNWSVLCHGNQEFQKWGGTEPLDDLEDVTECAGFLIWRSSARYWRKGYADITGMRLDAVKEDTKLTGVREDDAEDERIGWRLMIGRGGRLWGKQPKGSTRRVNPSVRSCWRVPQPATRGQSRYFEPSIQRFLLLVVRLLYAAVSRTGFLSS